MKEMVGGCCVCSDERGWAENPLVYCDGHGCNVAVHQACYGIVQVPTGPWFCRKCESQERAARVRCELCPQKDGALKRTDTQGWAHVVCALYIPEVRFGNVTTMEPIVLQYVPQERYNKTCYICEEHGRESRATSGAFMQCNKSGCKQTFHVTCAQSQGLLCEEAGNFMDNVKYCGYCAYHYKKLVSLRNIQKKESHIKTIPAFKPIPADNATPDSTPEKTPVKPEKSKVKEMKSQKLTVIEYGAGVTAVSAAQVNAGNTASSLSGKFTTANFTETTITSSGPGLLTNNSAKLKWPSQPPTTTSPSFSPTSSVSVTSPTALSEADVKPVGNAKGGNFSIIASIPLSDSKGEPLQVSSNKSSPLNHTSVNTSPTSRPESGAVTTSHNSNTATVSGTPTTATNSNSSAQPQTTSTFSYSFENFLRGNYPNPSTSQTTMPSASPPSTTTAVTETPTNQQPAKRPRAKSLEKGEKKKPKKAKQGTNGTTKAKTVKDLLASATCNSLSPPSSPVPVVPPVTSSVPTPATAPAVTTTAKKSGQKKRKDSSSSLASSISSQSFSVSASSISTPFSQSLTAASPVTMATIHKTGESLVNSLPSMAVSGHTSQSGVGTMGLLSTALSSSAGLSSSTVTSQDHGDNETLVNGTSPLLGPQRPNSTGVVTSPRTAADRSQSFPTSMEQLLERQWEQGSTFLMEQGQHFDIASLLSCLHQLRAENQRLEEHIQVLTARRDQLLAVNARLSMPLTPINNPHSTSHNNTSSHGTSPESVGGHNRSPRINNYIPPENSISQDMNSTFNRSTSRSPAQSHSPAHNNYTGGQGLSQGHSPAGPQPVMSHNSRSPGPEVRTGPGPTLSSSPAHAHSVMSESQRQQVLIQQQQHMFVNHQISSEQQQQLMLHMMQQQHQQQSALFPAATPTSMGSAPPARPSPMLPSQSASTPSKSSTAKQKEKT